MNNLPTQWIFAGNTGFLPAFGPAPGHDTAMLKRMEDLVANAMTSRMDWFKQLLDPRRDINQECGFPTNDLTPQQYQELYDFDSVAARVIEVLPKESWQVTPRVYEKDKGTSPFDTAWVDCNKGLRGEKSYYEGDESPPLLEYAMRVDIVSGIGTYGIILYGVDDGQPLDQPVKGVLEANSIPAALQTNDKGEPVLNADNKPTFGILDPHKDKNPLQHPYKLTYNAAGKSPQRKLLFVRVFSEAFAPVVQWEANPTSPRYGQPVMYNVTFNDPKGQASGFGPPISTQMVHWTRVQHVADTNHQVGMNDWTAASRCRPVNKHILSLQKIYGASGEGYWRNCFPMISIETNPQAGGDVEVNKPEMRGMMENAMNGLQKWILLMGMSAKSVILNVQDPTPFIAAHESAICTKLNMPVRIWKGSERGELASSQDDASWNDELRMRQRMFVTPKIIVPMVDRLINLGVLPVPASYQVDWPDLASQSAQEKAEVFSTLMTGLAAYVSGGVEAILPVRFALEEAGFDDKRIDAILKQAVSDLDDGVESGRAGLTGLVPGIIAMTALFTAAAQGALSEEQLKQQLIFFFGVDEEKADELIADGLTPTAEEAGGGTQAQLDAQQMAIDSGLAPDPTAPEEPAPVAVKPGDKLVHPQTGTTIAQGTKPPTKNAVTVNQLARVMEIAFNA